MYLSPAHFDQRGRKWQLKCAYKVNESQRLTETMGIGKCPCPHPDWVMAHPCELQEL